MAGGFIHSWTYLYRNESPSLVAIFVIVLFCLLLKEIPEHIWIVNVIFFAYDNMCNLANMRSFPNLWKDNLIKIIDSLYISTTTNAPDVDFNPNVLKKELPNANTMIWEQTFTWLGRFKKIMNHAFISWKFTYIYKLSSDRTSQLKIVTIHIKWYKRH